MSVNSGDESKSGFIDTSGKIIINPQFSSTGKFSDGLVRVSLSGKIGYIDKSGKYIINPQDFDNTGDFVDGVCPAYSRAIDKQGKELWKAVKPTVCGD